MPNMPNTRIVRILGVAACLRGLLGGPNSSFAPLRGRRNRNTQLLFVCILFLVAFLLLRSITARSP